MAVRAERLGSSSIRRALAPLLALALGVTACRGRQALNAAPPKVRGVSGLNVDRPLHAQPPIVNGGATKTVRPDTESAQADEALAAAEAAEEKPPRDFAVELVKMMGNPVSCLSVRAGDSAPTTFEIALTTNVMPSGAVARSEVQAAALEPGELQCLRARLETLHFAAPIENAPFVVRGKLTLQLQPTRAQQVITPAPSDEPTKASDSLQPTAATPPELFGPRAQVPAVPPPPPSEPGQPGEPVPPPPAEDKLE
jgi:hypothetical protein